MKVKNKLGQDVYSKEIESYVGQIPRIDEAICFDDGDMSTVTRVEWDFETNTVWVVCW